MAVDGAPSQVEMQKLADGGEVEAVPLDPEHKKQVEAMRIARLIEEGRLHADS